MYVYKDKGNLYFVMKAERLQISNDSTASNIVK